MHHAALAKSARVFGAGLSGQCQVSQIWPCAFSRLLPV
jgi:hypothetical protein